MARHDQRLIYLQVKVAAALFDESHRKDLRGRLAALLEVPGVAEVSFIMVRVPGKHLIAFLECSATSGRKNPARVC